MLEWYYLALISSLFMGAATIIEKNTLKAEHATAFSSSSSVLIAILSLVLLPFSNFSMSITSIILIYLVSLISTATYLITAREFKHGNLSTISPITSSLPSFFTVLLAFVFLGETLTTLQYLSILVMLLSTYFLLFDKKQIGKEFESNYYRNLLVLNSLIGAVSNIIFKYLLFSIDVYAAMVLLSFFMAINFLIFITFKYNGIKEVVQNIQIYKWSLVAIVVLTLFYRITYYLAIKEAPVSLVQPLRNTIFVIMTVLFGGFMLKEKDMSKKLIFSVILLVSSYLLVK